MENIYPFTDSHTIGEEAVAWLIRLDGDQALSPEAMAELQEWMDRSPQHRQRLTRLAATWNKLNVLTELSVPLDKPSRLRRHASRLPIPRPGYAFASVAGALVIGMAVLFALWLLPNNIDQTNGRYATTIGQQRLLTLADGSTLQLNTNTLVNVTYGEHYRDIHLMRGEAYFQVAKNKHKPFRVFAGKGRVQALGTAFSVYMNNSDVAVTVTEGRVALAAIDDRLSSRKNPHPEKQRAPEPIEEDLGVLVAGQGATLKSPPAATGSTAVETAPKVVLDDLQLFRQEELDRRLSWRQGLLIFSGESLEQVVREISRYTTVNIEIPEPDVRRIKVGGQFEVGDTDMMLEALEDAFALKVVRNENNRVLILAGKS